MLTITDPSKVVWEEMPLNEMAMGNAMDALFTLEIYDILEECLKKNGTYELYEQVISPSLGIFANMEYRGFLVDTDYLNILSSQLENKVALFKNQVCTIDKVKQEDNIGSNQDLVEILFTRDDGFCLYPPVMTKKGAPSVNITCLETLITQIESELEYRGLNVEKEKN